MKAADDPSPEQKPFLEHLEDFRGMIIRCGIAIALGMAASVPLIPTLLRILKAPLKQVVENPDFQLRSIGVVDGFTSVMQIAFWTGLVFSAPFVVLFIGAFILPALTKREQRLVYRSSGFAVALFVFGVWLGYTFTLPFALQAMYGLNTWIGVQPEWTLASYVSFTTQLLIAFGLAFELPMVLLALGRLGIVKSAQLRAGRRFAIVGILVLGAALTPPDIFSQLIMSVPLYLLYELCIWIIRAWEKPSGVTTNGHE
jgi:sec-independent protein translocase protein TatC